MTEIRVRQATPEDASFLAVAMLEADRVHTGIGSWDGMLHEPDEDRLTILRALAVASQPSYVHWSTFLIAEVSLCRMASRHDDGRRTVTP